MNHAIRTLAFSVFIFVQSAIASIELIETKNFDDVYKGILVSTELAEGNDPAEVLAVFDIDDTLLVMTDCVDGSWFAKAHKCPTELTDSSVPEYIQDLQARNFGTMALTARGHSLKKPTFRELKRHAITFAGAPFGPEFDFDLPLGKNGKVNMENGVVHAGGKNKGDVLELVQKQLEEPYKIVVFVDDNSKNIKNMEEKFKYDDSVHVIIYHYTEHRD